MEKTILTAIERTKQSGKFREKGFVAGVLYGDDINGANSVKFESSALDKVLARHGSNAKVWINFHNNKKLGFVKEVQRDLLSGCVNHIDVQMVSKDHEIRLQIPVIFKGEDMLTQRQLQLQVHNSELTVWGMIDLMPDAICVDVSDMNLGDSITLKNFELDKLLKVGEKEDAVYGIIAYQPLGATVATETK